jgi:16S rRNA (cytosine967-C5)-methyltransferase
MTPAARTQAAIDLLESIVVSARDQGPAADTLIARYFAERRYAGSKDRRAVRELVYEAIRLLGERPRTGRAAMLAVAFARPELCDTFDASPYGPTHMTAKEKPAEPGLAPEWLAKQLRESGIDAKQLAALVERAPLDIRVNRMRSDRDAVLAEIEGAEALPYLADGLRLPNNTPVDRLPAWDEGRIEVQDAGSQIVTIAAAAQPGMRVIDLCAGAGGKTLALAAAMEDRGEILATDTDRARLSRLPQRAARAGVSIATTRLLDPGHESLILEDQKASADLVLVDAPCSGTGTWRRNPEARWRLNPGRVEKLVATQSHVLDVASLLVKPGGSLTYIVCSLLDSEGAGQIAAFLDRHSGWQVDALSLPIGTPHGPGVRLTPLNDGTDGFFVAKLRRA